MINYELLNAVLSLFGLVCSFALFYFISHIFSYMSNISDSIIKFICKLRNKKEPNK